jgi:hypothetical protein
MVNTNLGNIITEVNRGFLELHTTLLSVILGNYSMINEQNIINLLSKERFDSFLEGGNNPNSKAF